MRSHPHTLPLQHTSLPLAQQEPHCQRMLTHNPLPTWLVKGETLAIVDVKTATPTAYGDSRAEFLHLHLDDFQPQAEVRRLRSRIWAEGELDRGATFSFSLPTASRGTER